jgi:hypothetical protein
MAYFLCYNLNVVKKHAFPFGGGVPCKDSRRSSGFDADLSQERAEELTKRRDKNERYFNEAAA